jgi:hypothetical protein
MCNNVLLPEPEGPTNDTTSPVCTDKSTPRNTGKSPNFLVMFLPWITAMIRNSKLLKKISGDTPLKGFGK